MKISDFKNGKILTEFGRWPSQLYEDSELTEMLNNQCILHISNNKRAELEAILESTLTDEEEEYILKILNSLCDGDAIQRAFANVLTYTTLRLVKDKPHSEWCVDKFGFYCCESERYEVNYIGILLKKIVKYVLDLAVNNRKMLTNEEMLVFLTTDMINNPQDNQESLPDFILNADLGTIRKWLVAKVLIHEMAHAFLDRPGKPHGSSLEESMANLITISVAEFFENMGFLQFVLWFIGKQDANYSFAVNLHDAAKRMGGSSIGLALNWAKCIAKDTNIFDSFDVRKVIFDQQNSSRATLADKIITDLSPKSLAKGCGCSTLEIKTWGFILDVCFKNHLAVKNYDPAEELSGTVTVFTQNKRQGRNIKLATLIRNYFNFLYSNNSWEEWKKGWNGFTCQIYEHLPHTLDDLEEILTSE